MRHNVAHRKLGRVTPHRIAMLRNMATALFERERIRTTLPEGQGAASVRREADHARQARRRPAARPPPGARHIQDPKVVQKLFDTIGARFATGRAATRASCASGRATATARRWPTSSSSGYEYKPESKADKTGKKEAGAKDEKKEAAPKAEEKAEAKSAAPKKAAAKKAPGQEEGREVGRAPA
jgi:large subunit ribosomal protein L17